MGIWDYSSMLHRCPMVTGTIPILFQYKWAAVRRKIGMIIICPHFYCWKVTAETPDHLPCENKWNPSLALSSRGPYAHWWKVEMSFYYVQVGQLFLFTYSLSMENFCKITVNDYLYYLWDTPSDCRSYCIPLPRKQRGGSGLSTLPVIIPQWPLWRQMQPLHHTETRYILPRSPRHANPMTPATWCQHWPATLRQEVWPTWSFQ